MRRYVTIQSSGRVLGASVKGSQPESRLEESERDTAEVFVSADLMLI